MHKSLCIFGEICKSLVSDLLHPLRNRQGSRARVSQESLNHHVTVCTTYGGPVKMSQFQMPENKFEVVSILHANQYYLDASGD